MNLLLPKYDSSEEPLYNLITLFEIKAQGNFTISQFGFYALSSLRASSPPCQRQRTAPPDY